MMLFWEFLLGFMLVHPVAILKYSLCTVSMGVGFLSNYVDHELPMTTALVLYFL